MFLKRVLSAERANDSFNLDILGDVPSLRHFPCFHFTVFAGSRSGPRFKLDKANIEFQVETCLLDVVAVLDLEISSII